ncbi:ABC transporter permease [Natrinema salaciae]|uniref:Cu-processing system permease protein n=1 Tax=Natrinema salaciae TaxID=1186196 RepID=A0A1H9KAL2_9EURY|nr:ABC transporter permease [Natrinema salaciae]SEQ95967.1 Cu-processing system permease protein [Natrinema salaciae]
MTADRRPAGGDGESAAGPEPGPRSDAEPTAETAADTRPKPDGGYETAPVVAHDGGSGTTAGQLLVVAETEYRLAVRSRWAVALTAIVTVFALGMATFSGSDASPVGFDRVVASLSALVVYLVPLVALAFSYDAVVGREESGWLQTLFSLPVSRSRVVLGTAVGRAIVLASATVIGFGVAGILLLLEYGFGGFDAYVGFLLAAVGLGLAFLAIGVCLSTLAREKTHALGLALIAWAWFVLVHDLLALGVIGAFSLPDLAISAMVVANPTGVFRALVLGALGAGGDAGFAAVLAAAGLSPAVLVAALLAWIGGPIALAAVAIRRRRV